MLSARHDDTHLEALHSGDARRVSSLGTICSVAPGALTVDTGADDTQDLRQEQDHEEAKKPFLCVTSPKAFREFLQKETIALCFGIKRGRAGITGNFTRCQAP